MKNKTHAILISLGIILTAAMLYGFADAEKQEEISIRTVPAQEFMQAYDTSPGAILLDVRTPEEFAEGHIEGAINLDINTASFRTNITKLDPTDIYFVYCRSGNRSAQAVEIMKSAGISSIYELRGGIVSNPTLNLVQSVIKN